MRPTLHLSKVVPTLCAQWINMMLLREQTDSAYYWLVVLKKLAAETLIELTLMSSALATVFIVAFCKFSVKLIKLSEIIFLIEREIIIVMNVSICMCESAKRSIVVEYVFAFRIKQKHLFCLIYTMCVIDSRNILDYGRGTSQFQHSGHCTGS